MGIRCERVFGTAPSIGGECCFLPLHWPFHASGGQQPCCLGKGELQGWSSFSISNIVLPNVWQDRNLDTCKNPIAFQVGPSAEDFRVCFSVFFTCVWGKHLSAVRSNYSDWGGFRCLKQCLTSAQQLGTVFSGIALQRQRGRDKQKQSMLCSLPDLRSMTVIT